MTITVVSPQFYWSPGHSGAGMEEAGTNCHERFPGLPCRDNSIEGEGFGVFQSFSILWKTIGVDTTFKTSFLYIIIKYNTGMKYFSYFIY